MYSVRLSNAAEKAAKQLDEKMRARLADLFKRLEEIAVPFKEFDLVKLSSRQNVYRVRLSSHRILYEVFYSEKLIFVTKIERRSETTYK
ncbi:MAG: type II toxin-antitoxin system RelE/ParE family toxin [Candidatus Micrarchaeota archaeon]